MSPIKLFFGLWILLPAYHGESIVYLCVSEYLANFELKIAFGYSFVISKILLKVMMWCQHLCVTQKSSVDSEFLPELLKKSEIIYDALKLEISIRKRLEQGEEEDDYSQ
jgi:hypothetical protein